MSEGIQELKELLKFIIEFGESIDKAMIDKKFEMSELGLLIAPLMQIGPAFEGLDKIGGEIKDLNQAEMSELIAYIGTELDLNSDKLELIIEKGLETAVVLYSFIQLFKKEEVVEPTAPVGPANPTPAPTV